MDRFSSSFRHSTGSFFYQLSQTSHCRFKGVTENGTGPTASAQGNITKEQFLELPAHLIGVYFNSFPFFSSYGSM